MGAAAVAGWVGAAGAGAGDAVAGAGEEPLAEGWGEGAAAAPPVAALTAVRHAAERLSRLLRRQASDALVPGGTLAQRAR